MSKFNCILMFVLCLCLWNVPVKSSLSTMKYEIVFSEPTTSVLSEKNRIIELYRKFTYGVEETSIYETILLNKHEFLEGDVKRVEIRNGVLIVYLDVNGKLSIKGRFENACENKIVKKTWINEVFYD